MLRQHRAWPHTGAWGQEAAGCPGDGRTGALDPPSAGQRGCGHGAPCGRAVLRPRAANIRSGFWQQTAAPYVSSEKREAEGFCRAGNCEAGAKYCALKPKVKGGAGREGWSVVLYPVPGIQKGEWKSANLDRLCL